MHFRYLTLTIAAVMALVSIADARPVVPEPALAVDDQQAARVQIAKRRHWGYDGEHEEEPDEEEPDESEPNEDGHHGHGRHHFGEPDEHEPDEEEPDERGDGFGFGFP